jgi:hypothetical protein
MRGRLRDGSGAATEGKWKNRERFQNQRLRSYPSRQLGIALRRRGAFRCSDGALGFRPFAEQPVATAAHWRAHGRQRVLGAPQSPSAREARRRLPLSSRLVSPYLSFFLSRSGSGWYDCNSWTGTTSPHLLFGSSRVRKHLPRLDPSGRRVPTGRSLFHETRRGIWRPLDPPSPTGIRHSARRPERRITTDGSGTSVLSSRSGVRRRG